MKKLFLLGIAAFMLSMLSCSKEDDSQEEEEQGLVFTGSVTFYLTTPPACDIVEVFLQTEDQTKTGKGLLPIQALRLQRLPVRKLRAMRLKILNTATTNLIRIVASSM